MDDNLDIPDFLRIPSEQRAEAWRRKPPVDSTKMYAPESNDTTRRYHEMIAEEKAAKEAVSKAKWLAYLEANGDRLKEEAKIKRRFLQLQRTQRVRALSRTRRKGN